MYLGAHLGIADGLAEAVRQATTIGAESLQIFSKSPQMWSGPALAPAAVDEFRAAVRAQGLRATAVHHGYLANLASPKADTLARSRAAFRDELARAERLGVDALIFHPGAHLGSGPEAGLRTLGESLRAAIAEQPGGTVRILLENAAGQGTTLGSSFEELRTALDLVAAPDRVGVALDTCHLFAAGFDFRSDDGYGALVDRVDSVLGPGTVRAFHLNDAKAPVGSHLDRHENIGKGEIGTAGFAHFVNDRRWADVPGYLETPLDDDGYARYRADLETLRGLIAGHGSKRPAEPRAATKPRRARTVK
ncbi:MAG TPA: deoxyribonuclease IV [Thermoplasmata archaeon]|nr:deoxyribonuclease IV [Thermoplasmata archaeon]